jgi:hypothetical protein
MDLPPYSTKEVLVQKITMAISEGSKGFAIG